MVMLAPQPAEQRLKPNEGEQSPWSLRKLQKLDDSAGDERLLQHEADQDENGRAAAVRLMDEMTADIGGHVREDFLRAYGRHPALLTSGHGNRMTICLADAVPPPLRCQAATLGNASAELKVAWPLGSLQSDVQPLGAIHEFSAVALGMVQWADGSEQPLAYHLYTDGSAGNDDAGWGVVALAELADASFVYIGFFGGPVRLNGHACYLGAECFDNISAEFSAIAWALMWSHQTSETTPVHLHFDCMAAGDAAAGSANVVAHAALSACVRTLAFMLEQTRPVSYSHVKGHSGQPWNELADRVANAGRKGKITSLMKSAIADWFSDGTFVGCWAFLDSVDPMARCAYPSAVDNQLIVSSASCRQELPQPMLNLEQRIESQGRRAGRRQRKHDAEVKVATLNVLTLKHHKAAAEEECAGLQGRDVLIMEQCHEHGLNIVGLQEARTSGPSSSSTSHYHVVRSGANPRGQYGCELWISTDLPFTNGTCRQSFFKPADLTIVSTSPRHILAAVRMKHFSMDVVVAHAPHSGSPEGVLMAWWQELQKIVSTRGSRNVPIICLIDANATVGSAVSRSIGSFAAEVENQGGDLFHGFLLDNDLCLPATFEGSGNQGRSTTWVSPDGRSCKRIDFVAVPLHWSLACVRSYVLDDIDLMAKRDDHFMSIVHLKLPASLCTSPLVQWRVPICDLRLLSDPDRLEAFTADLRTLPLVMWHVDAGRHLAEVTRTVRQLLAKHFPRPKVRARKPWISATTWSLLCVRRDYRTCIRESLRKINVERQALTFEAWSRAVKPRHHQCLPLDLLPAYNSTMCSYAFAFKMLDATLPVLRQSLNQDKQKYVEQITHRAAKAAATNDTKTLYGCVARLRGPGSRPPGGILLEDGTPAADPLQVRQRWQRHFAEAMAGEVVSQQELAHKVGSMKPVYASELDSQLVPSLFEMERLYASICRGKAAGVDSIPPEAFAAAPQAMARLYHPIIVKSVLRFEEPLAWKGGSCIELYKGKGPFLDCKSYRDVLVSDISGKAYHKAIRHRVLPHLETVALDTQCGGVASRGSDIGAHIVRQFLDYGRVSSKSVGVLFVDVVAAFASVIREIVLGGLDDAQRVASICRSLRLPHSLGQDVVDLARRGGVISSCGASGHLLGLLQEAHRGTWFSTEGLDDVVMTSAGTRAGDPLADVVFNLLMTAVLQSLRSRLRNDGLISQVQCHTSVATSGFVEAIDVSYVDDAALFVESPRAATLADRVSRTAAAVIDVFEGHGLKVNMQPGKTETLMAWRGPGSRTAKRDVLVHSEALLRVQPHHGDEQWLRVTDTYKHLGGVVSACGSTCPELWNRIRSGSMIFKELRRCVFADRRLPLTSRAGLADSLVDTRHLYNASTWPRLSPKELFRLNVARARPHRTMLQLELRPSEPLISSSTVLSCGRAMGTNQCISIARLRYLPRLQLFGPPLLHALLHANSGDSRSWMAAVADDIAWLKDLQTTPSPQTQSLDGVQAWMGYAAASKSRWRSMLRNAVLEEKRRRDRDFHMTPTCSQEVAHETHICAECGAEFGTAGSLRSHFAKSHLSNIARKYADGDTCKACLKRFSTRSHVIYHLAFSRRRCLDLLQLRLAPLSVSDVDALDATDCHQRRQSRATGLAPRRAHRPATQLHGPLLQAPPVPVTPPGTPPPDSDGDSPLLTGAMPCRVDLVDLT